MAITGKNPKVYVDIEANVSGLKRAQTAIRTALSHGSDRIDGKHIEGLIRPLGKITGQADEFEKSMAASNARVIAFGASVAIIGVVQKAFANLVSTTIEVEKSLKNIQIVYQANNNEMRKFGSQIFDVARQTKQSYNEVANGALELARQGLGAEETLKRLKDALILTRLSGMDSKKSVEGLTAAVNAYKSELLTTEQALNRIFAVETAFAASSEDLVEGISRSAATAEAAGVSFNNLISMIAVLQERTARGGSVIGNALRTIFLRIKTEDTLRDLQDLGVAVQDLATGQLLPATEIMKNLALQIDDIKELEKLTLFKEVAGIFRVDQFIAAMKDLADETSRYTKAQEIAKNTTNEAYKANEQLNKTNSALIEDIKLVGKELGDTIGNLAIIEGVNTLLLSVKDTIVKIRDVLSEKSWDTFWGKITQSATKIIGGILTGPGVVLFTVIIAKLTKDLLSFGAKSLVTILDLNRVTKEQKLLQESILHTLMQEPKVLAALNDASLSRVGKEEAILNVLREQRWQYEEMSRLAALVTPGLLKAGVIAGSRGLGFRNTGGKYSASGYLPIEAMEAMSVEAGVGGAPPNAKVTVYRNFPIGKGKKTNMAVNSSEYIVPNFMGTDGAAVFNADMMKKHGKPKGGFYAASGYNVGNIKYPPYWQQIMSPQTLPKTPKTVSQDKQTISYPQNFPKRTGLSPFDISSTGKQNIGAQKAVEAARLKEVEELEKMRSGMNQTVIGLFALSTVLSAFQSTTGKSSEAISALSNAATKATYALIALTYLKGVAAKAGSIGPKFGKSSLLNILNNPITAVAVAAGVGISELANLVEAAFEKEKEKITELAEARAKKTKDFKDVLEKLDLSSRENLRSLGQKIRTSIESTREQNTQKRLEIEELSNKYPQVGLSWETGGPMNYSTLLATQAGERIKELESQIIDPTTVAKKFLEDKEFAPLVKALKESNLELDTMGNLLSALGTLETNWKAEAEKAAKERVDIIRKEILELKISGQIRKREQEEEINYLNKRLALENRINRFGASFGETQRAKISLKNLEIDENSAKDAFKLFQDLFKEEEVAPKLGISQEETTKILDMIKELSPEILFDLNEDNFAKILEPFGDVNTPYFDNIVKNLLEKYKELSKVIIENRDNEKLKAKILLEQETIQKTQNAKLQDNLDIAKTLLDIETNRLVINREIARELASSARRISELKIEIELAAVEGIDPVREAESKLKLFGKQTENAFADLAREQEGIIEKINSDNRKKLIDELGNLEQFSLIGTAQEREALVDQLRTMVAKNPDIGFNSIIDALSRGLQRLDKKGIIGPEVMKEMILLSNALDLETLNSITLEEKKHKIAYETLKLEEKRAKTAREYRYDEMRAAKQLFAVGRARATDDLQARIISFRETLGYDIPMQFADGMATAMEETLNKTKTLKMALIDAALNFLQMIQRAALGNLADMFVTGVLGIMPKASGGLVTGGSGTRDDVPHMLTGGEYVIKKDAVQKYGISFLDMLNQGKTPAFQSGGYYVPGFYGQEEIRGKENLLAFATQRFTSGANDIIKSYPGQSGGIIDLENQSSKLTAFARTRSDSPMNQLTQEAQIEAFNLYLQKLEEEKQDKAKEKAFWQQLLVTAITSFVTWGATKLGNPSMPKMATTETSGQKASELIAKMELLKFGINTPRRAGGGMVSSGVSMLTGGEYVMGGGAVQKYGKGTFDRINSLSMPKFARGGMLNGSGTNIGQSQSPQTLGSSGDTYINITINDSGKQTAETSGNAQQSQKDLARKVKDVVLQVVQQEKRMGGSLNYRRTSLT